MQYKYITHAHSTTSEDWRDVQPIGIILTKTPTKWHDTPPSHVVHSICRTITLSSSFLLSVILLTIRARFHVTDDTFHVTDDTFLVTDDTGQLWDTDHLLRTDWLLMIITSSMTSLIGIWFKIIFNHQHICFMTSWEFNDVRWRNDWPLKREY